MAIPNKTMLIASPFIIALAITSVAALTWRFYLLRCYRPADSSHNEYPQIDVVITAYNEGPNVTNTINSVLNARYHPQKIHIIIVDDGSTDSTPIHIVNAAKTNPQCISTITFNRNRGKRAALIQAFKLAAAPYIITVDSDSTIQKDALHKIIAPLVKNPKIAAVAGRPQPQNSAAIIPKMLNVTFALAFDFNRAAQHSLKCVLCTPGCFSAYRTAAIKPLLQSFARQKFLNQPAKIAEDRALTNLLLKAGHYTAYQADAIAQTRVPEKLSTLAAMFLRWKRGNIRESIHYASFAFGKNRATPSTAANINFLITIFNMFAPYPLIIYTLFAALVNPSSLLIIAFWILVGSALPLTWYTWRYKNLHFLFALIYIPYWTLFLSWITPYALLTPTKNHWLTRNPTNNEQPRVKTRGC